nr:chemosensory protein 14 [Graphosoma rubrolineatum]
MRRATISAALSFLLVLSTVFGDDEDMPEDMSVYDKILEDFDVDTIINNDRLLDSYLKCFFNTGPCSEIAEMVKGMSSPLQKKKVWCGARITIPPFEG